MMPVFQSAAIAQWKSATLLYRIEVDVVGSIPTSGTFSTYVWFKNKCIYPHR